jgi:CopG family nickel-responsive transcriptional regulator
MSQELDRVSITLPPDLLAELDAVVADWEYDSRSEATRDAIRAFVTEHRKQQDLEGRHRGTVSLLYDHHVRGVNDAVLDLQHELGDTIVAVQHVHLGDDLCLETLVVNGPGQKIEQLVNRLRSLHGVKRVELSIVSASE